MKQKFSRLLAGLCVLGLLAAPALAAEGETVFTDQADIVHTQAVEELVRLNVLSGVGDGSAFAPKETVTRGEMCKLICLIMNGGKDPLLGQEYGGGTIPLSDIAGHWAAPYIIYCMNLGVVTGRGDGTFGPDDPVRANQGAKMLLVAMGYDAKLEEFEGEDWDLNATLRASHDGLLDNVELSHAADPLTRDNAAQMIYNALHADLIYYDYVVTFRDGETIVTPVPEAKDPAESLFSTKFPDEG